MQHAALRSTAVLPRILVVVMLGLVSVSAAESSAPVEAAAGAPSASQQIVAPVAPSDIGTPIVLAVLCVVFAALISVGAWLLCRTRPSANHRERSPLLGDDDADHQGPKSSLTV